jgi:hypothetical protein
MRPKTAIRHAADAAEQAKPAMAALEVSSAANADSATVAEPNADQNTGQSRPFGISVRKN